MSHSDHRNISSPLQPFVGIDQRPLVLRLFPDAVLRQQCLSIDDFGPRLQRFADDMVRLMKECRGIGLAAPQVGVLARLIVADIGKGPVCIVNPTFQGPDASNIMTEGCLSLPDITVEIQRRTMIEVRGRTPQGKRLCLSANGLLARVIQHEVDHLDGRLICDYLQRQPGSPNGPRRSMLDALPTSVFHNPAMC
jgi:peptide deformylase